MKKIILNKNILQLISENIENSVKIGLPKEIIKAIELNKHSLGNHPAFPFEDEYKFEYKLLNKSYQNTIQELSKIGIDITDENKLESLLSKLLINCIKIEKPIRNQLESICINIIKETFNVDQNDINFTCTLVDGIDESDIKIPLQPESVENVEFDGIEDIKGINDEIYKRRMIKSLMEGIAHQYMRNINLYMSEIFKLNPELPILYNKIMIINDYLNFSKDANKYNKDLSTEGSTSEVIVKQNDKSIIDVKAINFPSLLYESIKGMFDLISFSGLPQDSQKINYILKKSDFLLANLWDVRFGNALWEIINNFIDESDKIYIPYLFYYIIIQDSNEFNSSLQEIFSQTKKGREIINNLITDIKQNLDEEKFNEELNNKRTSFSNDEYYNINDL